MNLLSDSRLTVVFGAVVAVTAAFYVAFGPSATNEKPHEINGKRKKRKRASRGMPRGLHNSGNTCFVNAILQATSSCPAVLLWLEEVQGREESDDNSTGPDLFGDLLTVLKVVNAIEDDDDVTNSGEVGDPEVWAPARLFRTLRSHGWIINSGEQDAHEYFQVLFTTLEEELQHRKAQQANAASLLDSDAVSVDPFDLKDLENELETIEEKGEKEDEKPREGGRRHSRQMGTGKRARSRSSSGVMVKSGAELTLDNVKSQTRICTARANPFSGTLTNKVSFKGSGKSKSPTSSSLFNNITLNLPGNQSMSGDNWVPRASAICPAPVSLETLLQMFVSSEAIEAEREQLVKQLTFGRFPECLCFHIQRTAFENGAAHKRNDIVLFPTVLNMDNYAYNRQVIRKKATTPVGTASTAASTPSAITSPCGADFDDDTASVTSWMSNHVENYNNNYLLRAVVVHIGAVNSGHYVTYRREPENHLSPFPKTSSGSSKWYYTSDTLVREISLDEVLKTNPYMLFYEKIHATPIDLNLKPEVIDQD